MFPVELLALLIALLTLLIGVFLTLGISRLLKKPTEEERFYDQLAQINKSELDEAADKKENSWSRYWHELYTKTGRAAVDENSVGRGVIVAMIVATLLGFAIMRFPGLILFPALTLFAARSYFRFEVDKRTKTLDRQLPILLSSLRANLQARVTAQAALITVANEIPAPLGDELRKLRSDLNVNVPLDEALDSLADRVNSREIKFLVSSIQTAVSSGEDLDPQLATIQGIVEQRTRIRNKLATAVSEVSAALWVSGILIPGSLVFSFMQSETNREFWLSFWGLIAAFIVGALYAGGLLISRKLVKGVENT